MTLEKFLASAKPGATMVYFTGNAINSFDINNMGVMRIARNAARSGSCALSQKRIRTDRSVNVYNYQITKLSTPKPALTWWS